MGTDGDYTFSNLYCRFGRKSGAALPGEDDEYKKNFNFEEGEELLNELNNMEGVSEELANNMHSEIFQAMNGPENILIVGTEGTKTITIISAPKKVVKGRGPVLVPTSEPNRIVAMVSQEFIDRAAQKCQEMEDQDGAQELWEKLLSNFFERVLELSENSNPDLLKIPDFIPEEGF